jgi:hypothetical protein
VRFLASSSFLQKLAFERSKSQFSFSLFVSAFQSTFLAEKQKAKINKVLVSFWEELMLLQGHGQVMGPKIIRASPTA